jgi:hypothetical protein
MAVMPANTMNYENGKPGVGGANSIPPSKFGGNVDNWRIGKGVTMYYTCEVAGGKIMVGDTHAAQGDSELAGTAMETSMTVKLKVTLHKKASLPITVQELNFPLIETDDHFVVSGFAFEDFLDQLEDPSSVFVKGASVDLALENCFNNTRKFIMRVYDVSEPECIALMATSVDFGITQIVDGNWGVHAIIPKWVFADPMTPYDYSCSFNNPSGMSGVRRLLTSTAIADEPAHVARHAASVKALDSSTTIVTEHAEAIGRRMLQSKLNLRDKRIQGGHMGVRVLKALKDAAAKKAM